MLAAATTNFIETVGFQDADGTGGPRKAKTVAFSFQRPATDPEGKTIGSETVSLEVPVLSIVNIPNLMVQSVDVTFDMEVKSSVSSQQTTDKSGTLDAHAKYHVSVQARQGGTPEGLSRVLDILTSAVQPKSITPDNSQKSIPAPPAEHFQSPQPAAPAPVQLGAKAGRQR